MGYILWKITMTKNTLKSSTKPNTVEEVTLVCSQNEVTMDRTTSSWGGWGKITQLTFSEIIVVHLWTLMGLIIDLHRHMLQRLYRGNRLIRLIRYINLRLWLMSKVVKSISKNERSNQYTIPKSYNSLNQSNPCTTLLHLKK